MHPQAFESLFETQRYDEVKIINMWIICAYLQEEYVADKQQYCIFCLERCDADIFAQEPVGSCTWCQAATHVRCFRDYHAQFGHDNHAESSTQSAPSSELLKTGSHELHSPGRTPLTPRRRKKSESLEKSSMEIERAKSGRLKDPPLQLPRFDLGDGAILSPARVRARCI